MRLSAKAVAIIGVLALTVVPSFAAPIPRPTSQQINSPSASTDDRESWMFILEQGAQWALIMHKVQKVEFNPPASQIGPRSGSNIAGAKVNTGIAAPENGVSTVTAGRSLPSTQSHTGSEGVTNNGRTLDNSAMSGDGDEGNLEDLPIEKPKGKKPKPEIINPSAPDS